LKSIAFKSIVFVVILGLILASNTYASPLYPVITLNPTSGFTGTTVLVTGHNFFYIHSFGSCGFYSNITLSPQSCSVDNSTGLLTGNFNMTGLGNHDYIINATAISGSFTEFALAIFRVAPTIVSTSTRFTTSNSTVTSTSVIVTTSHSQSNVTEVIHVQSTVYLSTETRYTTLYISNTTSTETQIIFHNQSETVTQTTYSTASRTTTLVNSTYSNVPILQYQWTANDIYVITGAVCGAIVVVGLVIWFKRKGGAL
jgi:hypothetical protein